MGVGITTQPGDQSRVVPNSLSPKLEGGVLYNGVTVKNLKMKNWVNVRATTPRSESHGQSSILFDQVTFAAGAYGGFGGGSLPISKDQVGIGQTNIFMNFDKDHVRSLIARVGVYLKQVTFEAQGVTTPNTLKQVFFEEQLPSKVIDASAPSLLYAPLTDIFAGQPRAAVLKTNQELWDTYGVAAGGMLAPADSAKQALAASWGILKGIVDDAPTLTITAAQRISLVEPWDGAVSQLPYVFVPEQPANAQHGVIPATIAPALASVGFRWRPRINGGWTLGERIEGVFKHIDDAGAEVPTTYFPLTATHQPSESFVPIGSNSPFAIGARYEVRAYISRQTGPNTWAEFTADGSTSKLAKFGVVHDVQLTNASSYATAMETLRTTFNSYERKSLTPRISYMGDGTVSLATAMNFATGLDLYVAAGKTVTITGAGSLSVDGAIVKSGPGKLILNVPVTASASSAVPGVRTLKVTEGELQLNFDLGSPSVANWNVVVEQDVLDVASPTKPLENQPRATLTLATSQHLDSLAIRGNGSVLLPARVDGTNAIVHGDKVLRLKSLTIDLPKHGLMDLNNNALTIDYTSPATDPLSTIRGYIAAGFNSQGIIWRGYGIRSSVASGDASGLTAIGVIDNSDGIWTNINNNNQFNSTTGESVATQSILVKFTYVGDTDLSGNVNGDDQVAFQVGYADSDADGWDQGDTDYNGIADGDDLISLLVAYSNQGQQL